MIIYDPYTSLKTPAIINTFFRGLYKWKTINKKRFRVGRFPDGPVLRTLHFPSKK